MSVQGHKSHDELIGALTSDLSPVRPLPAPIWRTLFWFGAVVLLALCGAMFADMPAVGRRLMAAPDMWLAAAGALLTALLAAFAAFQLSLPDRSRLWALLPLPAAAVWVGASGLGCLRLSLIPGTHAPEMSEERDCLLIIIGLSIPLTTLLIFMVRKAFTLQPELTALTAGLAAAAAAAALLNLFHPFDATASDLLVHAAAVAVVILGCRFLAARTLSCDRKMPRET